MICAACGHQTPESPHCVECGTAPLLGGRYRLDRVIGRGGGGITYAATRLADGARFCVKELAFHRLASLDVERLFRREAAVLRQLEHPQIPAYVDEFVAGTGKNLALYLVQAFVDGDDLQSEMAARRYQTREALEIADELLQILEYLQELQPQVVHRDIKPSNIMRRRSDGRLVLVDFGSVKRLGGETMGHATIAGTYGYMAPEQFRGEATLQTDLYAVGAVILALVTGADPAGMADASHELHWRQRLADRRLDGLLGALLAPDPRDRPAGASEARALLRRTLENLDAPAGPPAAPTTTDLLQRGQQTEAQFQEMFQQAARIEPLRPRRTNTGVLVGAIAAVGVLGAGISLVISQAAKNQGEVSIPARSYDHACKPGECAGLDRPIKDRLAFGMSEAQAKEARPELAAGPEDPEVRLAREKAQRGIEGRMAELRAKARKPPPPGHLEVRMVVAKSPATCDFFFDDTLGLAELDCQLDAQTNGRAHGDAERRLVDALVSRYGVPQVEPDRGHIAFSYKRRWQWSGPAGTLSVESNFTDMSDYLGTIEGSTASMIFTSKLRVTQTWGRLVARRTAAAEAEERQRLRTLQAERDAAERLRRQELKRLQERGGADEPL